jgi:Holliday junction resolvase RusA-like endonuclease
VTITLSGEPKSTNHLYKSVCRGRFPSVYLSNEGRALKEAYTWEAKAQWRGKPLEGDVALSVTFFFGTKRKTDLDNFNKLWQDALSGIVYQDDGQIAELHLRRSYDKARPRIEISLVAATQ